MKRRVYHDMPTDDRRDAAVSLWDQSWSEHTGGASVLDDHDEILLAAAEHISRDAGVLEAGCGNGRWLSGLTSRGY